MRNKTLTVDDFLDKKFIEFENLDNRYIWDIEVDYDGRIKTIEFMNL